MDCYRRTGTGNKEDITENDRLQPGRPVSQAAVAEGNSDFKIFDTKFIYRIKRTYYEIQRLL